MSKPHVAPAALARAPSHACARCSYKRHTQRSTHFSALLDAYVPPLPSPTRAAVVMGCSRRWRALSRTHLTARLRYRDSGGLDSKRGNDEHEQLLRSCGWAIRAEEMETFRLAKEITGRQMLSSSW